MAGSGQEDVTEGAWSGRESLPQGWVWSKGPHGRPEVVGRPSWRTGSGREALPEDREWSGGPHGGLGGPSGGQGVVESPSR